MRAARSPYTLARLDKINGASGCTCCRLLLQAVLNYHLPLLVGKTMRSSTSTCICVVAGGLGEGERGRAVLRSPRVVSGNQQRFGEFLLPALVAAPVVG
jgi:hypothetical protein